MKRAFIGAVLLLSGLFVDGAIFVVAAIMSSSLTEWQTNLGKFGTALLTPYLSMPFLFGILLILFGLAILGKEYFDHRTR